MTHFDPLSVRKFFRVYVFIKTTACWLFWLLSKIITDKISLPALLIVAHSLANLCSSSKDLL